MAFSSANVSRLASSRSSRVSIASFFWKAASLPVVLASHQQRLDSISKGRTAASCRAMNRLARASLSFCLGNGGGKHNDRAGQGGQRKTEIV